MQTCWASPGTWPVCPSAWSVVAPQPELTEPLVAKQAERQDKLRKEGFVSDAPATDKNNELVVGVGVGSARAGCGLKLQRAPLRGLLDEAKLGGSARWFEWLPVPAPSAPGLALLL